MVMQLRSLLKHIVDDRGLSIQQVAKDIDYDINAVEELYYDEMDCYPRELVAKLCTYLGIPVSDLFGLEGE
ncbi:hypothetical protein P378_03105 [Desulforamulus profundi]|uniref:HTH cro/C1-type domain-containing protein n=1 Tax=Desulforamulus profundi TaxID=1383067 RepID=A0A2C6MDP3_9FIRM|nr:helix-turn-helix transcriptional regulator [Desulforamulus profundi]PHJ39409.1 hypothetical protein P378_03105 [Desulforamulus profundi]